jgi:two-component system, cell cycle sensor histidine kinase and response regulator CckA
LSESCCHEIQGPFEAIFAHSALGLALVDMEGRPIVANPALVRILGYSANELAAMTFTDFTHPDDVEADWAFFQQLVRGERESYTLDKRYYRKDGELVHGRLSVSLIRDRDGRPESAVGMLEDITDLKRTEEALRLSEDARLRAQRMEAIGRLAGGVAHDFNNLLVVVLAAADLIEANPTDSEATERRLADIREAALRAGSLTYRLLAFARQQELEVTVVDLNELVERTLTLLRRVIPANIAVQTHLDPSVVSISADPSQLEQVIMNLALNARDAMPGGGRLEIATVTRELDAPCEQPDGVVVPKGTYARLTVADDGPGMDEATASRAFDPFFTTRQSNGGTGLGLSTVFGIVKQSGGYVTLVTAPREGTRFTIFLPAQAAA